MKPKVWSEEDFSSYIVTGKLYQSNRNFKAKHCTDWRTANRVNLWRGHIWGIFKSTNKRVLLVSIWN